MPIDPIQEKTQALTWVLTNPRGDAVEVTVRILPEADEITVKLPRSAGHDELRSLIFLAVEQSKVQTPEGTTLADLDCMSPVMFAGFALESALEEADIEDGALLSVSIDQEEVAERINQRILHHRRDGLVKEAERFPWARGATAECVAAHKNDCVSLAMLIENGKVNLNQACETGDTPISLAASAGNAEAMAMLLQHKGDPRQECRGQCPVYIAAEVTRK